MGQRTTPAMPPVVLDEAVAKRGFDHLLIDRHVARTHREPALVNGLFTNPADQLAPHLLGEIAAPGGHLVCRRLAAPMPDGRVTHPRRALRRPRPAATRHPGQR